MSVAGGEASAAGAHAPVDQDDTALRLAADKCAAGVVTASTLAVLAQMQAPTFSPGWEIPVTLRAGPECALAWLLEILL